MVPGREKYTPVMLLSPASSSMSVLEWSMHPAVNPSWLSEYALGLSGTNSCCRHGGDKKISDRTWAGKKAVKKVSMEAGP